MLQWMGGSRRKVATSRRSTHKRQKEYFEQRRRQQQQQSVAAGLENSYEESGGDGQKNYRQQQHRSLDVLNLHNLSTLPSQSIGREDTRISASLGNCHTMTDPPIITANSHSVASPHSLEIKEPRTLSSYQPETVSPKALFTSPNIRRNSCSGTNNKLDPSKTAAEQQPSFFDLLADDAPNGNSEGSPVHEAHVAFSIEGLGKLGAETPPHSPWRPDRYVSYGHSSPLKAARQRNSSKDLNYVLDDLELEVDAIMQNSEMPLRQNPLGFAMDIGDSYGEPKNNLPAVTDSVQLDGHSGIRSLFSDRKTIAETENYNADVWDATCTLWGANFLDERKSDMSWKSWPNSVDSNSADFLKYDAMSDYDFEGSPTLKKRDAMKAAVGFNILESTSTEHQTSENDFDFLIPKGARQPSLGTNFGFADAYIQPDQACFVTEDARDNQSLLSEESCSSTAVRGEETEISRSNSTARHGRRCRNASSFPQINCRANNIFFKGKRFKNREDVQKGKKVGGSGNSPQMPTSSESRYAHNLGCSFLETIGLSGSSLFREGNRSEDMNMGYSSLCETLETKHPFSGSMPWTEDTFGAIPAPEPEIVDKFFLNRPKNGSSVKYSPSGSFVPGKFAFCQPSSCRQSHDTPMFSKAEFGVTKTDFSPDSPDFELEVKPLASSGDTVSCGERFISDSSAQESVSKDTKKRSNFHQVNYDREDSRQVLVGKNMNTMDALVSEKNGPDCKVAKEEPLDMSSSVKFPDKSESSIGETEYHDDAEVPVPCQSCNEEVANEEPGERKIAIHGNCPDSSPPVVMLESYVLQLLCVQKASKEASVQTR